MRANNHITLILDLDRQPNSGPASTDIPLSETG
jgi:hypothetical protein